VESVYKSGADERAVVAVGRADEYVAQGCDGYTRAEELARNQYGHIKLKQISVTTNI
jgi:hypothetical protein